MSQVRGEAGLLTDELAARVGPRTLEILDQRRSAPRWHRRARLVRRALLVADVVGLVVAFVLTKAFFSGPIGPADHVSHGLEYLALLALLPTWVVLASLYGLYGNDAAETGRATADDLVAIFHLATVGAWIVFGVTWLADLAEPYLPKAFAFWGLSIALVTLARSIARAVCQRRPSFVQNTLVVGAGEVGQAVARTLLRSRSSGVHLVGFVDSAPRGWADDLEDVPLLGGLGDLPELVSALDVERVVIAFSNDRDERTLEIVRSMERRGVHVDIVPRLFEFVGPSARLFHVQGLPFLSVSPPELGRASLAAKRAFDIVVASLGLVLAAPVLAYLAIRVKLDSPGPVLYRSGRIGAGGRRFQLLKFRTMKLEACRGPEYGGEAADTEFWRLLADPDRYREFEQTRKLGDDPRVTKFGRFLRSTSLDELPQLVNVIKGDLSLVGPRAITIDEYDAFMPTADAPGLHPYWEIERLRPGITGLWQISGRSALAYDERIRLDLVYATGQSFRLDLLILAKTVRALLTRDGAC